MGINLDKMRAKLDALHNKGKKESLNEAIMKWKRCYRYVFEDLAWANATFWCSMATGRCLVDDQPGATSFLTDITAFADAASQWRLCP